MPTQEILVEAVSDDEVLRDFFSRGGSIRMLSGVASDDLTTLHNYACQLFDAGELDAARNYFYLLAQVDHWRFEYWLGLGMCQQRLGAHQEAIFCFCRAGMIEVEDPRSSYFAGISYHLTGNQEYACKAFKAAIRWCAARPQYQELRQSVEQLLAQCEQEKKA
ncbi:TPA: SycD/LcrH family type III secretion system chaperone [Pseudomonas aeruginosa]|nr:SycD/LcrH family type III secretion system chaperone [Pseudomonas aeruginosa]HEK1310999.1 SycD/LcrH family type III secretion system chaperone [Pseudomonas aeruginosa]